MATTFKSVSNNGKSRPASAGDLNNTTDPLTFSVTTGEGARFPATGAFYVTIWDDGTYADPGDDPNMEIGLVASRSTNQFTSMARGQLGTSAVAHANSPRVALLVVDQLFEDIHTAVNSLENNAYQAGGTDVPVTDGGTGASTLTDHGILLGSGTAAITPLGAASNGQLPIGSTGADPVLAALSEGEGIDVTNGAGTITIAGEDASDTNKGIVELATVAETAAGTDTARAVTPAGATIYANHSIYRQAIINGNFDVWQRAVSFTNPVNTNYLADRWFLGLVSSAWAATATRETFTIGQTDVPNNPKYFFRLAMTTATTTYLALLQNIEGVDKFAGMNCTLSFWARVSSGTYNVTPNLIQNFGTGGSPSTAVTTAGAAKTLTTSWQKFTHTYTLPSIASKTLGTAGDNFLQLQILLTNSQTVSVDISQVQLNEGSVALPFMPKSFEEELTACKRYFEKSYPYATAPGTDLGITSGDAIGSSADALSYYGQGAANTNRKYAHQRFQVEKRSDPIIAYYDLNGTVSRLTSVDANGQFVADNITEAFQGANGNTNSVFLQTAANIIGFVGHWTASAEL